MSNPIPERPSQDDVNAIFDPSNGMGVFERTKALEVLFAPSQEAIMVEQLTKKYFIEEKAKQEAKRLLASEDYKGTVELSWEDLEAAERSFMVQDFVPDDGVVFLFAKPNLGKTFSYIDMTCRMATGLPWLGKTTRQAKVLLVLGEGRNGYIDRLQAWASANGKSVDDLKQWLFFIDGANLNNDQSIDRVQHVASREEVELIVFDTYANVSGAQSEDDTGLNSITMNRAMGIRPGATCMFIHHPRKTEEDTEHPIMRGSTSLAGRADVVLSMYRDRKFSPKTGEKREWLALSTAADHGGKNRSAKTETIRGLYLEEHGGSAVLRQLEAENLSKESRKVQDYLRGVMTVEAFALAAGVSASSAGRYLRKAAEEGTALEVEIPGSKAKNYKLVDEPVETIDWVAVTA